MKLDKATLKANINNDLADNASQQISPRDVRQNMIDVVDSVSNLMINVELVGTNFSTPATRTTIAGEDALSKLGQESYVSVDNVAVGYAALKNNFQGERNTAIGSYALSCNIYGTDNVAIGYAALDGNSTGVGNVGVGEYTLYYNKTGSMNVAIGHGAGYYADQGVSNKLFIGVHPVSEQYVCDNPEGVGLTPLMYGDFNLAQIGVNVNSLHPYGSLQVSGAISPSEHNKFALGHSNYYYTNVYAKSVDFYDDRSIVFDGDLDAIVVSGVTAHAGDVDPHTSKVYALGSPEKQWHNVHTYNLNVTGTAQINELQTITSCLYECKTIYMATSGVCEGEETPCGYLPTQDLTGAGLVVPASGGWDIPSNQLSRYKFILSTPASGSVDPFSKLPYDGVPSKTSEEMASWVSNTNIEMSGDTRIISPQYLGSGHTIFGSYDTSGNIVKGMMVGSGLDDAIVFSDFANIESNNTFDNYVTVDPTYRSKFRFVNEFSTTQSSQYDKVGGVELIAKDADVPVSLKFFNDDVGNRQGADITSTSSGVVKGLFFDTYDGTSSITSATSVNTLALLQDDSTDGVFGVHNFAGESRQRYPETIINARSNSDAALRITAENAGDVTASLELCGEENCLSNAVDFVYNKTSGVAEISTYLDSGRVVHVQYDTDGGNTIFPHGNVDIGNSNSGVLGLKTAAEGATPSGRENYTQLYSRYTDLPNQSSELVYVDTSGNVFPVSTTAYEVGSVYLDSSGNLFVGSGTPSDRSALASASGNTAFGSYALHDLTISGAPQGVLNTAVGYSAGSGVYAGSGNVIIGSENVTTLTSGVANNIIIGNKINYVETNNSIILGNNIGSGIPANNFLLGNNDDILLSGVISNNELAMPTAGSLAFYDASGVESTKYSDHSVLVKGSGNRYGDNPFVISFSGTLGNDLLTLDHSSYYTMSNSENYESVNPRRPFMHLDGDMRLRGAVRFSDGTSLDTASGVLNLEAQFEAVNSRIDTATVEGTLSEDIPAASNIFSPVSGIMTDINGGSIWIVNRDRFLTLEKGDYVVASRITYLSGDEYRPVWVSNEYNTCGCARPSTLDGGTI